MTLKISPFPTPQELKCWETFANNIIINNLKKKEKNDILHRN